MIGFYIKLYKFDCIIYLLLEIYVVCEYRWIGIEVGNLCEFVD